MFLKRTNLLMFVAILVLVVSMISFAQSPILIKLSHGDTAYNK